MESQHLTSYLCARKKCGELQDKDRSLAAHQMEEDGSPVVDREIVDTFWTTTNWTVYDGNVRPLRGGGTEVRG